MRSKVFQRILDNTPNDVEIFVDWYADLVVRINQLLHKNNINKKELAAKMDKSPSEISKWLNGEHNFTLRSLAKLSAELGEPLLKVTKHKVQAEFLNDGFICKVHSFVSYPMLDSKISGKVWQMAEEIESYNELNHAG
jgi:transcriptional regulator with XRE-family HTH domain